MRVTKHTPTLSEVMIRHMYANAPETMITKTLAQTWNAEPPDFRLLDTPYGLSCGGHVYPTADLGNMFRVALIGDTLVRCDAVIECGVGVLQEEHLPTGAAQWTIGSATVTCRLTPDKLPDRQATSPLVTKRRRYPIQSIESLAAHAPTTENPVEPWHQIYQEFCATCASRPTFVDFLCFLHAWNHQFKHLTMMMTTTTADTHAFA